MVGMWKWLPWSGLRGAVDAKQKVLQAAKLFMSATVLRRYPLGIPKRTPKIIERKDLHYGKDATEKISTSKSTSRPKY
jgi:hypothetical protein